LVNSKQKICFIVPSLRGGGAEKVTLDIIEGLDTEFWSICLIVLNRVGERSGYRNTNIEIIDLGSSSVRMAVVPIIRVLFEIRPSVVYSTLNHLNLTMSFVSILFPSIAFVGRQTRKASTSFSDKHWIQILTNRIMYSLNLLDVVVVQSIGMRNDLIKNCFINPDRISLINNPLNLEKIAALAAVECKSFNSKTFNIVSVGRLEKSKGLERLIDGFSLLDSRKFSLSILGDGSMKQELIYKVQSLGLENSIKFLGYQKNPYKFIQGADILVLTSYSEGFSNTVVEAMACGKFVVAYPFYGQEIIKEGVNGFIVKEENTSKFVEAIKKAQLMERNSIIIKNSVKHLASENVLAQYYSLFKLLI